MKARKVDFEAVAARIGHAFADPALLERALTHVSAVPADPLRAELTGLKSYQRLEFLGDRVLGLAVSSMLYKAFPEADEGELSQRLALLVQKSACAEVAATLELGPAIRLGPGAQGGGVRRRTTILGDVCEAVIGAIYLDAGYEASAAIVDRLWRPLMLAPRRSLRDPKTTLQEWAHARGLGTPVYREIDRLGPDHKPEFCIAVTVEGLPAAEGRGLSKRVAEQAAAEALIAREKLMAESADAN